MSAARTTWLPGDVIAFAGRGPLSRAIAWKTCSWWQLLRGRWISHVGIVAPYFGRPLLFESTTLTDLPCEFAGWPLEGVQAHAPRDRLERYEGRAWRYRLRKPLPIRSSLTKRLVKRLGIPYDHRQACLAGTHYLKRIEALDRFDGEALFCSELVTLVLIEIGVIAIDTNPSIWTPAGWCRWAEQTNTYDHGVRVL